MTMPTAKTYSWPRAAFLFIVALLLCLLSACQTVDDDRIPNLVVSINLADPGLWNTYGVVGAGDARYFIRQTGQPANFPYTEGTYTGFGGVLLVSGYDPILLALAPQAYDLACPVECRADVRVFLDYANLEAVCPMCGSHYNVFDGGGMPTAGPAYDGKYKYSLRRYRVIPGQFGGYIIVN